MYWRPTSESTTGGASTEGLSLSITTQKASFPGVGCTPHNDTVINSLSYNPVLTGAGYFSIQGVCHTISIGDSSVL